MKFRIPYLSRLLEIKEWQLKVEKEKLNVLNEILKELKEIKKKEG